MNFFNKKPDNTNLKLDAMRAASYMPLKLDNNELDALQSLLDVVRQQPEEAIIVQFSGASWLISKDEVSYIKIG